MHDSLCMPLPLQRSRSIASIQREGGAGTRRRLLERAGNLSFFLLLPREEALLTVDDLGAELTARRGELFRLALGRDGWCVQMINVNQRRVCARNFENE